MGVPIHGTFQPLPSHGGVTHYSYTPNPERCAVQHCDQSQLTCHRPDSRRRPDEGGFRGLQKGTMTEFAISREEDDKSGILRVSMGGNAKIGYYLVFRGEPEAIITMLKRVTEKAGRSLAINDYTDKRGKG